MNTRIDGASCQIIPDDLYTSGEPSLNRLAAAAGDRFDVWQRQINRIILAKSADGFWSARNAVLSIPRQTGKTYDIGWVAIHRAARTPGMRVVWTAQHLSDSAMASMLPTQNRAWNPQTIYMGTPPGPRDNGEAFTRLRDKARAGRTHSTLYVEFTADRDADPLDRDQWRKANPSYPSHTSDESIANLWENLTGDDFRREALGIWDEHALSQAIDRRQWEEATIERRRPGGVMSFGIDMNPQRTRLTIGACMRYDDNTAHIELAEYRDTNQDGTMWAVNLIDKVWEQTAALVIDGQSPATALLPDLAQAGVTVTVTAATDMGRACGRLQDMLRDGTLTHLPEDGQQPLWQAANKATTRPIGKNGLFGWNRPDDDTDISPLNAVTLALHGAMTTRRDPTQETETWF